MLIVRRTLWRAVIMVAVASALCMTVAPYAGAASGQENFEKVCAACHTIGQGKRVGPDLLGVNQRRSQQWLLRFIAHPQQVIASGDPIAVELYNSHNKTQMPDAPFSEAEIKEILTYIASTTGSGSGGALVIPNDEATIRRGAALFEGRERFAGGGPACNSCHHVRNDAVIGGGVLAKDLTVVFSTMGGRGVQAILGQPPFPVMTAAFEDKPLTPDEIVALIAFLQDADKKHAFQRPRDFGLNLLLAGSAVFVVLMCLFALVWRRRKVLPVNHAIFQRQLRTE